MYSLLLAIIYLAFISLGLPDSLLGAAWPTIYAEMDIPISYMGIVTLIISSGTILSSLLSDRVVSRLGVRRVTAISILLTSVALFGFSTATKFYHLCLWGIPYGLGAGSIDAALNNYVALHYNSKHMSWLHCFWGVGTIISPYVMSYTLAHSNWMSGYRVISLIQLGIMVIVLMSKRLWASSSATAEEKPEIQPIGIREIVKMKGVLPVLIGFTSYCALEATTTLWASSYFEGVFNMSKDAVAALGSLPFIGITVGRFLSGFISDRLGDSKMIRLGASVVIAGIVLISLPLPQIAIVGFLIIGLGCAPIYPCIIHSTPTRFGKERSQSIIGVQMASAYLGASLMPPLFGIIANHISLSLMPIYLGVFVIMLITMFVIADKTESAKSN